MITKNEALELIRANKNGPSKELLDKAVSLRKKYYGDKVYIRGLIEFTNYCKNNCYYCGLRCENKNIERYRLSKEDILSCCDEGYGLGFRTFVLQGGEDMYFNDNCICDIVYSIKEKFSDCAVTLSIGEKSRESYKAYFDAGTDRYLLRHETANNEHYAKLHPHTMSLENRKRCLYDLKDIGFQTGAGFMVGSPYQSDETLAEDIVFLAELEPEMVGIGPFIPQHDSPFRDFEGGSVNMTLVMLALTRTVLPKALLPATTALGSIDPIGREKGLSAGANVLMPNLSPSNVRKSYALYDNKLCNGDEAAQNLKDLEKRVRAAGFEIAMGDRGDFFERA